jgi:hypothetical protein
MPNKHRIAMGGHAVIQRWPRRAITFRSIAKASPAAHVGRPWLLNR